MNHRHADFQSAALPLSYPGNWGRLSKREGCIVGQFGDVHSKITGILTGPGTSGCLLLGHGLCVPGDKSSLAALTPLSMFPCTLALSLVLLLAQVAERPATASTRRRATAHPSRYPVRVATQAPERAAGEVPGAARSRRDRDRTAWRCARPRMSPARSP